MITDQMVEAALMAWDETMVDAPTLTVAQSDDHTRKVMRAALLAAEAAAPPDPRDATIAALRAEVERLVKDREALIYAACLVASQPRAGRALRELYVKKLRETVEPMLAHDAALGDAP